ncbi:MAG: limonene-1,2-epoxide hydrolase family protein [Caulobacterales bacterium]|jgi:limonene-1,2-epoxide hydrolase
MSNLDLARAFIAACERKDWQAVHASFTDDVVYHNIPMPAVKGADVAVKVLQQFMGAAEQIEWEVLSIADDGVGKVLNERVDRFTMSGGKHISLPVCGVFEFRNAKISAWRDYFDLADFQRQMAD